MRRARRLAPAVSITSAHPHLASTSCTSALSCRRRAPGAACVPSTTRSDLTRRVGRGFPRASLGLDRHRPRAGSRSRGHPRSTGRHRQAIERAEYRISRPARRTQRWSGRETPFHLAASPETAELPRLPAPSFPRPTLPDSSIQPDGPASIHERRSPTAG
jgi:hypothetical protein